jgi:Carboxypeptidase regulatory-like domain
MMRATLLLIGAMVGGVQLAQAQAVPRTVSGRVFDDTTGCPLGGVQIQAVGGTGHALTNAQGRYRLGALPEGEFVLQAAHGGYQPKQTLTMTVSDSSARVDFSLVRATGDSAARVGVSRRTCQLEPPGDKP